MDDCYRIIRQDYRNNVLNTCPSPLRCSPRVTDDLPSCMVLSNKYEFTRFTLDLQLASPTSAEIVPKSNCLLS